MNLFQAIILGIIEGVTEFLPISSTGHLIIAEHLLQIKPTEFLKSFDILIQMGAILAVICLYSNKIISSKTLWRPITLAFIPTGVLGAIAYPHIKNYLLNNITVTVISLFVGGIILLLLDRPLSTKPSSFKVAQLPIPRLLLIGIFQSFSFIPGVSRAAASIIGGLSVGLSKADAVEFSFLLAIPTMAVATGYDMLKSGLSFSLNDFALLGVGFVSSFITALIAIKAFLRVVTKTGFTPFAIYRIVLAVFIYLTLSHIT